MAQIISPECLQTMGKELEAKVEVKIGKGRVVLYRTPASNGVMQHMAMNILDREMDRSGVKRWCRSNRNFAINLIYAGRDRLSGRHIFVVDFTRSVKNDPFDAEVDFWTNRTFTFTFDPSLSGSAELIGLTNSFESCKGGQAEFDLSSHVLKVKFNLPQKLNLTFGNVK